MDTIAREETFSSIKKLSIVKDSKGLPVGVDNGDGWENLVEFFYWQVDRLLNNKFYLLTGIPERKFTKQLLALEPRLYKLKEADHENKNIPFLIIPPFSVDSTPACSKIMSKVESVDGKKGLSMIKKGWALKKTPNSTYLSTDIDVGYSNVGLSIKQAQSKISKMKRETCTDKEGIMLFFYFPEIFSVCSEDLLNRGEHFMMLLGSRCESKGVPFAHWDKHSDRGKRGETAVPELSFYKGRPRMWCHKEDVYDNSLKGESRKLEGYGFPSCAKRIAPKKFLPLP
ncbi:MAG: hypothetical protein IMF07_08945 [Proteobacteria bacterium]|nr:hypothetical protein [Pseudomonadota bacterium]